MTLTPEENKVPTQVNVYASRPERQAFAKAIDDLRDRMIFDVNSQREKIAGRKNSKALQGAPDEAGATDPMMYIKLDNALRELRDAVLSESAVAEIDFKPNEISNSSADPTNMRQYSTTMNKIRNELDTAIVKRKDKTLSSLFGSAVFKTKAVYDLGVIEGLTSGKKIEELIKAGKVVPEYGATKVPAPTSKHFYEPGSYPYLINSAYIMVVEDDRDEGLIENFQMPINIDGGGWKKLMDFKKGTILPGTGPTTLSAYKDIKALKPKTKLDILQMAAALSVGQNEGLMGPRPILPPEVRELTDPDINQKRKYYIFVIGGYKGTRSGARTLEIPEDVAGIPSF